jgi:hypothetical protein
MKRRYSEAWILSVIAGSILLLPIPCSYALPVLDSGKFFAPSTLFQATQWSYSGTLPSTLSAGFKAQNVDDDWFGDSGVQYATGSRSVSTTTGSSPAYVLALRGEFEQRDSEAWDNSLLDQSKGVVQTDIDSVDFPAPDGGANNEHPIPASWQSLNGYANPAGTYAKFDQTLSLSRTYLEPGEFGCPQFVSPGGSRTGSCIFTGAYFKAGANLEAALQGYGSIENVVAGTQSVSVDARANRITTFKVNGDAIYSGEINGTASTFTLEEESVKSVDFSFNGSFADKSITIGGNVQWDGRGDVSEFDASYVKRVDMPDYVNVGLADKYLVEVRDDPQLQAGLAGTDFYKAKVYASTGLSAIDATLMPVFQPLASSRLVIKDASTYNIKSSELSIPEHGFKDDLPIYLHFLVGNEGTTDLTLIGFEFKLIDLDIFSDDLLAYVTRSLDYIIHPNSALEFALLVTVSRSQLNAADDFFEGGSLEIRGSGSLIFQDIYGVRAKDFELNLPEPGSVGLLFAGLPMMRLMGRKKRGLADACRANHLQTWEK